MSRRSSRSVHDPYAALNNRLATGRHRSGVKLNSLRDHAVFVFPSSTVMLDFNDCVYFTRPGPYSVRGKPKDGFEEPRYDRYTRPMLARTRQFAESSPGTCFLFATLCSVICSTPDWGPERLLKDLVEDELVESEFYAKYEDVLVRLGLRR